MVDEDYTPGYGKPWADEQLLPAEKILLKRAKMGEEAQIRDDLGDPNKGEWPAFTKDHEIRAKLIRHMLIYPDSYQIDPKGIDVVGAHLIGELDLNNIIMQHQLMFAHCIFNAMPQLIGASTRYLNFHACRLPGLIADGLQVENGLFLRLCMFSDEVRLNGAKVNGNLECTGTTFSNPGGCAFNAQRLTVTNRVFWIEMKQPPTGDVDFTHAKVGEFLDDEQSWPQKGTLHLDGLTYDSITSEVNAEQRIRWLARMAHQWKDEPAYWPQPYEQLIKVFKAAGHERDARQIAIAKQDALRTYLRRKAIIKNKDAHGNELNSYVKGDGRYMRRMWLSFSRWAIRYGYESWRSAVILIFILFFGNAIFAFINDNGLMEPAKERIYTHACYTNKTNCPHWVQVNHDAANGDLRFVPPDYPEFNAFVYSVDVLLPIVDMKLESHWMPGSRGFWGSLGRAYFWLHIALGWVFTTIAVVGFTGLVKQDKD